MATESVATGRNAIASKKSCSAGVSSAAETPAACFAPSATTTARSEQRGGNPGRLLCAERNDDGIEGLVTMRTRAVDRFDTKSTSRFLVDSVNRGLTPDIESLGRNLCQLEQRTTR